ncbi:MAG: glycine--tRNA ligase subunit beta [Candidatus Omnitrophica bacterium]|nr:glycine--tRNA ligase subunit beta [Candidatus Omnitrophota bacterium]
MIGKPVRSRARGRPRPGVDSARDFLLEIGCEELPADYMPGALDWDDRGTGLASSAGRVLTKLGVASKKLQCFGTPRRLVLLAEGVAPEVRKEEKGPPAQVAFDPAGKPTRAAEAFARKHGLNVNRLSVKETPKGRVVFAEYSVPVTKVLSEAIPEIIGGVAFPKTMRWDESGVRFARPVRWLVALYGPQVVQARFGLTGTGRVSQGTRRSGTKVLSIPSASAYFALLKKAGITLEEGGTALPKPKRRDLLNRLTAAARELKGRLPEQGTEEFEWLLDTVAFLAEDPVVQAGSFRPEYLDLPAEVLATSMAKHLKLFSVRSAGEEKLLPRFLGVLEGKPPRPERVMANVERILEARFTDARFFYREDTKSRLEEKMVLLDKVVFHEKLGSIGERIPRLEGLMMALAREVKTAPGANPDVLSREIRRIALLAKADLVTQMVREFPSLQGTIGAHYARADGEPQAVVQAIGEQYRPRAGGDPVPSSLTGALVSLADRLDTLLGYFGVGLSPTGSADPFGLRRQALGLVRILLSPPPGVCFVGLSIDRLCDEGIQSWGSRLTVPADALKKQIRAFLRERFEWVVGRAEPLDRELVAAVLAAGDNDPAGAAERLEVLRRLWGGGRNGSRKTLEQAAKVAERTARIVQSVKGTELPAQVDAAVFTDPTEKELWAAWNRVAPRLKQQISERRFEEAAQTYSALFPTVHTFFEKVFVMDENMDLRRNRLALLREIHRGLAAEFADLSKLPLAGVEP